MEIGPVNGIRAISLLSVQRHENDARPIFEIDASAKADEETYSSNRQTPDRGLEGEEFDSPPEEEVNSALEALPTASKPGTAVNLFA